jgi:hypothetical protein
VANVTGMSFMQYYSNNISPKNPGANILLMKVGLPAHVLLLHDLLAPALPRCMAS